MAEQTKSKVMTTDQGRPVGDNQNSLTVGQRGPIVFKDYLLFQHGKLFPFFASLEAVEDPFPDERVWRIWDAFIYFCQKFGIVYGGDLWSVARTGGVAQRLTSGIGRSGAPVFTATAQKYLKRVLYGNFTPRQSTDFLFELVFDYGDHRAFVRAQFARGRHLPPLAPRDGVSSAQRTRE